MENGLTASDVALLNRDSNNSYGWGDNVFMWIFALLILAGGGFGGCNNNGYANALTQSDLQRAIDLNSIQNGQRDIEARIQEVGAELGSTVKDSAYNNLSELRDIQSGMAGGFAEMQKCCCETQRAIDGVNYNIATQSAAIQANATSVGQRIIDKITENETARLKEKVNSLELQQAVSGVVRYPMASTYTSGTNPFCHGCCY